MTRIPQYTNLGIQFMDNQHKKIMDLIQKIHTSIQQKKPVQDVLYLIEDFEKLLDAHNGTEERYMQKYHYPGLNDHARDHMIFTKNIDTLKKSYARSGGSERLLTIIEDQYEQWHKHHFQNFDGPLAAFLLSGKLLK